METIELRGKGPAETATVQWVWNPVTNMPILRNFKLPGVGLVFTSKDGKRLGGLANAHRFVEYSDNPIQPRAIVQDERQAYVVSHWRGSAHDGMVDESFYLTPVPFNSHIVNKKPKNIGNFTYLSLGAELIADDVFDGKEHRPAIVLAEPYASYGGTYRPIFSEERTTRIINPETNQTTLIRSRGDPALVHKDGRNLLSLVILGKQAGRLIQSGKAKCLEQVFNVARGSEKVQFEVEMDTSGNVYTAHQVLE